ncbi:MAG: DUF3365 domain-containing protein [Elusimicrobia bacterium]|nr:DUF3365 domain-containing protein [Elusimicrobiota bacterium]
MDRGAKFYVMSAGLILGTAVCSVMLGMAFKQDEMLHEQARKRASALADMAMLARDWNTAYGGVFVERTPSVAVSPFTEGRDFTAPDGKAYTLKSHMPMIREISERARISNGFAFRITGLEPLNPVNTPDDWEKAALSGLKPGEREATGVVEAPGGMQFRSVRPLYSDASCRSCHGGSGGSGTLMGGISVTLPYQDLHAAIRRNFIAMLSLSAALLVLFGLTIYFLIWKMLDRLSRQKAELAALNETKDRLLGMAAHDLRTPLAGVVGLAGLLREESKDPLALGFVEGILESSARMLGLINELLDVTKINTGKLDLKPRPTDIKGLLVESVRFNAMLARQKDIAVVAELPDGLGTASVDPDRFKQVLDNLISNAVKYSDPRTTVTVGARLDADGRSIWVQDQGVGIKEEELGRVFDEFFKASSRPTAGESSHGLGLAIVKKIVESHGGTVSVNSAPGKGSRFVVRLPKGL